MCKVTSSSITWDRCELVSTYSQTNEKVKQRIINYLLVLRLVLCCKYALSTEKSQKFWQTYWWWVEENLPQILSHLVPQRVILFGNWVFADIINYTIMDLRWVFSTRDIFIKEWRGIQRYRRDSNTEKATWGPAEIGVLLCQTKEHKELPEAGRGKEGISWQPSEGKWSYQHFDFRLWPSIKKNKFLLFYVA